MFDQSPQAARPPATEMATKTAGDKLQHGEEEEDARASLPIAHALQRFEGVGVFLSGNLQDRPGTNDRTKDLAGRQTDTRRQRGQIRIPRLFRWTSCTPLFLHAYIHEHKHQKRACAHMRTHSERAQTRARLARATDMVPTSLACLLTKMPVLPSEIVFLQVPSASVVVCSQPALYLSIPQTRSRLSSCARRCR